MTRVLLAVSVIVLLILCFLSIAEPMRFDRCVAEREKTVKQYLLQIRTAETAYLKRNGSYTASFDTLVKEKFLADSLRYIPYSGGKQFDLQTATHVSTSGKSQPLMVCSAHYADYLNGLDEQEVASLTTQTNASGRFPGLKIGDITAPNGNVANWE